MTLGEALRALRQRAGVSQHVLSVNHDIGINTIRGVEQGRRTLESCHVRTIQRMVEPLGATLELTLVAEDGTRMELDA